LTVGYTIKNGENSKKQNQQTPENQEIKYKYIKIKNTT
jgi:hypothetical protein